jgi:adenylate kinase family enzyme
MEEIKKESLEYHNNGFGFCEKCKKPSQKTFKSNEIICFKCIENNVRITTDKTLETLQDTLKKLDKLIRNESNNIINISNYEFIIKNSAQLNIDVLTGFQIDSSNLTDVFQINQKIKTQDDSDFYALKESFLKNSSFNFKNDILLSIDSLCIYNNINIDEIEKDEFDRLEKKFISNLFKTYLENKTKVKISFYIYNHELKKWNIKSEIIDFYYISYKDNILKKLEEYIKNPKTLEQLNEKILHKDNLFSFFIGQNKAKQHARQLIALSLINKRRQQLGITIEPIKLGTLFIGEPGTGKTTFAKDLGNILHHNKILSQGNFFLATKADLVGEYIGHTESKVKSLVAKAKGSILFIDEAYNLVSNDNGKDFGHNALQTLMEEMDKCNNDIMVIFGGYEEDIKKLLNSNDGYKRRFPHIIKFESFNKDELLEILVSHSVRYSINFTDEQLSGIYDKLPEIMQIHNYGNGGFITNLLEGIILKRDIRLYNSGNIKELSKNDLLQVKLEDINQAWEDLKISIQYN